jgi:hypothetical protein
MATTTWAGSRRTRQPGGGTGPHPPFAPETAGLPARCPDSFITQTSWSSSAALLESNQTRVPSPSVLRVAPGSYRPAPMSCPQVHQRRQHQLHRLSQQFSLRPSATPRADRTRQIGQGPSWSTFSVNPVTEHREDHAMTHHTGGPPPPNPTPRRDTYRFCRRRLPGVGRPQSSRRRAGLLGALACSLAAFGEASKAIVKSCG